MTYPATASAPVPPACTDDGNGWTTGTCWLYCRRSGVRVLCVGTAVTPNGAARLYACGGCLAELDWTVRLRPAAPGHGGR
ncbi:hypothetical protein V1L54_09375 [Streptomyces sp. TRM 70361]|uniref:hypothetical protein n=1 Tax=Streptomyces sp. TRM 70361 TaxID=3116553 RepID=UPI002E7ABD4F|nr:hypothetical protein [Streptomyces sp. TRM 70361]MEE1939625.1 hypothetical protein [Streptomyces sp. TRM 70361]